MSGGFSNLDEAAQADLEAILVDVLSSVAEDEAVPTRYGLPPGELVVARLAIHDGTTDEHALVEVRTGTSLARVIAARMLFVAVPADDDVIDAVAEVGNIVGGNVKTLLCQHARLSLPSSEIVDGPAYAPAHPGDRGTYVRAVVLGHVAELALRPDAPTDGLMWPPHSDDEMELT